jgi:hypothetical protein
MAIALSQLDDALAERGMEAQHHTLEDDATSYLITAGSAQIELLDATDGEEFDASDLAEVIYYGDKAERGFCEVTSHFLTVDSVADFLKAVDQVLA